MPNPDLSSEEINEGGKQVLESISKSRRGEKPIIILREITAQCPFCLWLTTPRSTEKEVISELTDCGYCKNCKKPLIA